jgi:hypothetical protein
MANRAFIVALVMLLVATRISPSYCADMLEASTAPDDIAAEAPVQQVHQHHHFQVSDESAPDSSLHVTATAAPCGDCGDLAATAVTHSSSKHAASLHGGLHSYDPRVYPSRRTPAGLLPQDTSPDRHFLAPLRI